MSPAVFVDTSAWFALTVPGDANHAAATAWLAGTTQPFLTTDYIIDETLTLLKARGEMARALRLGQEFFAGGRVTIYHLSQEDVAEAWEVFQRFRDKEWSFTDCTSKAVIEKLGLAAAFTFDRHFRQFGSVLVVP